MPESVKFETKLHNRFDITVADLENNVIQTAQAENIILNQLWGRLFNGQNYHGYVHLGSGSGTFAVTRTSLFNIVISKTNQLYFRACKLVPNTVLETYMSITLGVTEGNGVTFTEVGIGYGNAEGNLCTHAPITDANGNAISITKTPDKTVTIEARFFISCLNWHSEDDWQIFPTNKLIYNSSLHGDGINGLAYMPATTPYASTIMALIMGLTPHATIYAYLPKNVDQSISIYKQAAVQYSLVNKKISVNVPVIENITESVMTYGFIYNTVSIDAVSFILTPPRHRYNSIGVTANPTGTSRGFNIAADNISEVLNVYINGVVQDPAAYSVDLNKILLYPQAPANVSGINNILSLMAPQSMSGVEGFPFDINNVYVFFNHLWERGLSSIATTSISHKAWCSNDLVTWFELLGADRTNIPTQYRKYKYWATNDVYTGQSVWRVSNLQLAGAPFSSPSYNLTFISDTPPVNSIITADIVCRSFPVTNRYSFKIDIDFIFSG